MHRLFIRVTCVFLLSLSAALWAQSNGGTLSGRITSADGAAIPNASVTVTNVNTNASQKVLSAGDGTFSLSSLQPGTYRVEVETAGFKRISQQNVELSATGPTTVNLTLEAGNTNETVEIKGVAPMTQTSNGEVGVGVDFRVLRELPIIDRNHQDLVQFTPGVTPPTPALDFATDPDRNRFYSTDGQSPWLNQNYVDGVTNQEFYRGTAVRIVPEEMIQQFNVSTTNLTMDKGFTAGAYTVDNSRGGGNSMHGSLFEFWSGNPVRTRNFFDTLDTNAPRFTYNQFGATVGGPIVRDRLFYFGSYEGQYNRGDNTEIGTLPTPQALTGNFSAIPGLTLYSPNTGTSAGVGRVSLGNVIPSSFLNPTSAAIASLLPSPNQAGLVNNYVSNTPYQLDYQKADGRIDYLKSEHTSLFFRYGFSNNHAIETSPLGSVIGSGTRDRLLENNATIAIDHSFGGNLITDTKFGYSRYDSRLGLYGNQTPLANMLGLSAFSTGLVGINIPGLPLIGSPATLPENPVDNTFNWVSNWSLHSAKHSLKWGVDIRRVRADGWLDSPFTGLGTAGTAFFGPGATLANNGAALSPYSTFYNSFAAFLIGAPSEVGSVNYFTTPTIRQTQYSAWLGDTIHVLHRVTLDLGARYEIYSPLSPRHTGGALYYDAGTNNLNYAGVGGTPFTETVTQTRNIAPRVGMAFNLNDRTVIRGGYGIEYFQTPYMLSGFMPALNGSVMGVQGTYSVAPGVFGPTVNPARLPGTLASGVPAGSLPVSVIPRNLPTPYVQTFHFQIQRDFYYGSVLSVGYVGALDRHLPGIYNLNAALPGTGIAGAPFAALGQTSNVEYFENGMTSNYNALQVSLNKRMSQGLALMAAYTYSKSLGYTTANGELLNPFNLRSNYGPTDYDRQHVLSIAHLWEIPFGRHGKGIAQSLLGAWQLNGVVNWQTGVPLTLTADPLLCACPGTTVLAGTTGGQLITGNYGNGQSYFNAGAFNAAAGANVGNLSRNALRGPDSWNYNLSLFKNFHVLERFNLQVRGEAYNLSNTVHPLNPVTNINSPGFGQITGATPGAFGREVKFGAMVQF
ncbi:MAG: TonB-dependent receptor [Acidobacteriia bacterium]|nr:TonB-dependent receptor [Terriglobia bacterium]